MKEAIYGFPCVTDPRDFTPDEESCTAEEIAQHKADCEAAEVGTYQFNAANHSGWVNEGMHVTRAPWGIGTNMVDIDDVGGQQ